MRSLLIKIAVVLVPVLVLIGCRHLEIEKNTDGSWRAHYFSYGMFTMLGSMSAQVDPDGTVRFDMNGYGSDMSTNHAAVVESGGIAVGSAAGEIIERVIK